MRQKDRSNPERTVEVGATAVPTTTADRNHVRVTLTGARAGKTCTLNRRYQFTGGVMRLPGSGKSNAKTVAFLERFYGAKAEEVLHGQRDPQAAQSDPRGGAPVVGDAQPAGGGSPPPTGPLGDGAPAAPPAAEAIRVEPHGDGHGGGGAPPAEPPPVSSKLHDLIVALDPSDDKAWTSSGSPGLTNLEKLFGGPLSRARVDAAAPGWSRDAARRKRQEGLPGA